MLENDGLKNPYYKEEFTGSNPVAPTRVFQKSLFISIFY